MTFKFNWTHFGIYMGIMWSLGAIRGMWPLFGEYATAILLSIFLYSHFPWFEKKRQSLLEE